MEHKISMRVRKAIKEAWNIASINLIVPKDTYEIFEEDLVERLDEVLITWGQPETITEMQSKIFSYWNSQENLIKHKVLNSKMRVSISRAIREYGETVVLTAIDNYNKIMGRPDLYFFTYKWTLADFVSRGIERFQDWEICRVNFLRNKMDVSRNQPITGKYEDM